MTPLPTAIYFNVPQPSDEERRRQMAALRVKRTARMQALKREILIVKARRKEFDGELAELRALERDEADELKEAMRLAGRRR